ncbi:MAG: energy transducer TonB [Cyclobacteriaceae bacterium]
MESKKNPKADLSGKSALFLNIGLCCSLLFVIFAFEWKSYDDSGIIDFGTIDDDFEDILDIPQTEQPPPTPPQIKLPELIEVPDEEEIEEELDIILDIEVTTETEIDDLVFEDVPGPEVADQIFEIVEESAGYPGGLKEFYKYLQKELKYPRQAQRMNVEGKVFVQYVVEKDGSLTDIKVVRGVGSGCDEEAVRVLQNSPKWNPGKQRGVPVRQKMFQAISFKLRN